MSIEQLDRLVSRVTDEVSTVVFGQEETVRFLVGAFLIGGHVLLEGPPGIGKTLLARSFASVLGRSFKRIQFTPDLMPSDVTGVSVFDRERSAFRFVSGPIFAEILLADEINRTPPKTQSALLEAMEERSVTVDGERRDLGQLFFVIATQNPIEHEGTFPLPEAQLDRFIFRLLMTYPPKEREEQMIRRFSSPEAYAETGQAALPAGLIEPEEVLRARETIRRVAAAPAITDYITRLAAATREHPKLLLGASPRSALFLTLAAKMTAALDGRDYVIPDDVQSVIHPVLNHRLIVQPDMFDAAATTTSVIDEIVRKVPVPEKIEP